MFLRTGIACLCILGLAISANADSVPVADSSFESAGLSPGGWSDGPHGAWTEDNDGSNGSFIEVISGFASEGTHHIGINSLVTSTNNGVVPAGTFQYSVWQDLGMSLQPNTDYTLTVGVGKRNAGFNPAGGLAIISVVVDDIVMAEDAYDASGLPDATFVDRVATFTTDASPIPGNIVVKLTNLDIGLASGGAAIGARSHFDNIRLEAVPIPEPSSLALLASLAFGLIAARRRLR